MVSSKVPGENGERIPGWFKSFLQEYRKDREEFRQDREDTQIALKVLAESQQHLTEEVRDLAGVFHLAQKETNLRLRRMEQELTRTRKQSPHLFFRLIAEVKALRSRS